MGTPHPSDREHQAIQRSADQGDESATRYIALLDACTHVLECSNGISQARRVMGERENIYAKDIDEALAELLSAIFPENEIPSALKALDALYYKSYDYDQDGGASYEQAREQLERQVRPLGFTLSYAECEDAGAGADRYNHGGMRHVLLPRDRELGVTDGDPRK